MSVDIGTENVMLSVPNDTPNTTSEDHVSLTMKSNEPGGGEVSIRAEGVCWTLQHQNEPAPQESQIRTAENWIATFCRPRKLINARASSYELKHRAEDWTRKIGSSDPYISNGAFIAAALRSGYRMRPHFTGSPNAFFNMRLVKPVG
jgi:hypothetical protein